MIPYIPKKLKHLKIEPSLFKTNRDTNLFGKVRHKANGDPEVTKTPKEPTPTKTPAEVKQPEPAPNPIEPSVPVTPVNEEQEQNEFLEQIPYEEQEYPVGRSVFEDEENNNNENEISEESGNQVEQQLKIRELKPIERSFLKSIKEDPNDMSPRLIYADWLEEIGNQPYLAEMIRLSIMRGQLPLKMVSVSGNEYENLHKEFLEIETRMDELNTEHGAEWQYPWVVSGPTTRHNDLNVSIDKGMLTVGCPAHIFAEILNENGDNSLALVNTVRLYGSSYDDEDAIIALLHKPKWISHINVLNVANLAVSQSNIPAIAEIIATLPETRNLIELNLLYNGTDSDGAAAIAQSPYLANLQLLDLSNNEIDQEGAYALAKSPYLNNITEINLHDNYRISLQGRRALKDRFGDKLIID